MSPSVLPGQGELSLGPEAIVMGWVTRLFLGIYNNEPFLTHDPEAAQLLGPWSFPAARAQKMVLHPRQHGAGLVNLGKLGRLLWAQGGNELAML